MIGRIIVALLFHFAIASAINSTYNPDKTRLY